MKGLNNVWKNGINGVKLVSGRKTELVSLKVDELKVILEIEGVPIIIVVTGIVWSSRRLQDSTSLRWIPPGLGVCYLWLVSRIQDGELDILVKVGVDHDIAAHVWFHEFEQFLVVDFLPILWPRSLSNQCTRVIETERERRESASGSISAPPPQWPCHCHL